MFLQLNLICKWNLFRFILSVQVEKTDVLEEPEVNINQALPFVQSAGFKYIAFGINPNASEAFLGCIKDLGDIS